MNKPEIDLESKWHRPLLSKAKSNAKTRKSLKLVPSGSILYLASHDQISPYLGFKFTVCAHAKLNACWEPCLDHAGRGATPTTRDGRLWKTLMYVKHQDKFMAKLRKELHRQERAAIKKGLRPRECFVRLDGTSDLGLAEGLHHEYPGLYFYDYTKNPFRMNRWLDKDDRDGGNYHLTFSLGAGNRDDCIQFLEQGANVAVVFDVTKGAALPDKWYGYDVVDGDEHDLCYLRPPGTVIGLRTKSVSKRRRNAGEKFLQASKE